MELTVIEEKAYKVASRIMNKDIVNADMKYDIWDWQAGVGMYGLFRYWKKTGREDVLSFLKEYAEYHTKNGLGELTINTTAPINLLMDLDGLGEQCYSKIIERYVSFCRNEAERTEDNVLVHSVIGKSFTHQIWSDTLFMGVLLLARYASQTKDSQLMSDVVYQMLKHFEYLMDEKTGLLFHGYDEETDSHLSSVRWGRANGWALITAPEILLLAGKDVPEGDRIIRNYKCHLDRVLSYIDKDGYFRTVLDNPSSPREMTITSCILYSISLGRKLGILDPSYDEMAEKILPNLLEQIDEEGNVNLCSGGTPIMESEKAYCDIPNVVSYYGQGLALLALSSYME